MLINHIHTADARHILPTLPTGSVHSCVTSPPYFGLRDYGHPDQIGLETTPEDYILNLVGIFAQIRRILRHDGTLWLNLGDSYANDTKWGGNTGGKHVTDLHSAGGLGRTKKSTGLKPKDLIGIPWRVALALQAEGWYLRQDIIWHKPNPMPESVTDRCTKAHEYLFLLTKSEQYYYDADAISEPANSNLQKLKSVHNPDNPKYNTSADPDRWKQQFNGRTWGTEGKRNRRSVWTIATQPYPEAHFATYPIELPRFCIAAGSPDLGIIIDPFFGAGTTGLAALQLNRQYIGIELIPSYTAIAYKRLAALQNAPQLQFNQPAPHHLLSGGEGAGE